MTYERSKLTDYNLEKLWEDYSPLIDETEAIQNYDYDRKKFLKYSCVINLSSDPVALEAVLTHAYHALEKGLTMEVPRPGFGVSAIILSMKAIIKLENLGCTGIATQGARGMLQSYVDFHKENDFEINLDIKGDLIDFIKSATRKSHIGGSYKLSRKYLSESTNFDYERFIQSRSSVRHFTGDQVDPKVVKTAVRQSLKAPRSCNRETRRVYVAYDQKLRDEMLSFQNGNRGFGPKLGVVLMVTVDLRHFDLIGERNQGWIDGGLFAMSLVNGLHAANLGTCMLNWSECCESDKRIRKAFHIPDYEIIITMIGAGHVPDEFEVTASPAPDVDDVLSIIKPRE
jgi:nitroreductase